MGGYILLLNYLRVIWVFFFFPSVFDFLLFLTLLGINSGPNLLGKCPTT
jgi:hypothetical protein